MYDPLANLKLTLKGEDLNQSPEMQIAGTAISKHWIRSEPLMAARVGGRGQLNCTLVSVLF